MTTLSGQKIYTDREVAEILGCSWETIQDYCRQGVLKARKAGRNWRILEESVRDYLLGVKR